MKWKQVVTVLVGLLAIGLLLVGCGATPEPCPDCPDCPETECPTCPEADCPAAPDCPDCPAAVECPECPAAECPAIECPGPGEGVPFAEMWAESAHADFEAEAFRHWDEDDPAVVPASCAKCHSEGGALDFFGADGTEAGCRGWRPCHRHRDLLCGLPQLGHGQLGHCGLSLGRRDQRPRA